jgi:nucleotide-binding universal stress UspA family protein
MKKTRAWKVLLQPRASLFFMNRKMRILIAYDGSESAGAALSDLPRAGLSDEADALLFVSDIWLPSSHSEFSRAGFLRRQLTAGSSSFAPASRAVEEERALSREASRRFRSLFPAWDVRVETSWGLGMPDSELIRRAISWKADLIVVGSKGYSTADGNGPRHASHKVVGEAPCSVRISRPASGAAEAAVRLVVGADGSTDSHTALTTIASRKWPAGSECRVVMLSDSVTPPVLQAVEEVRGAGLKTSIIVRRGDPQAILAGMAREWGADCIFVGSNGHDGKSDPPGFGSVAASLAACAPCSVEVARTGLWATAGAFIPLARAASNSSAAAAG